ncbi:MAG: EAL domain-containing response regulator [Burkholderiaceae bacterium]
MGSPAAAQHTATQESPGGIDQVRPRILLVDDDLHMLELQRRMLVSLGFPSVSTSHCATQALQLVEDDPGAAQVLICDLGMPGMDGIEFLQFLNHRGFQGSVVLLSGAGAHVMHSVKTLLGAGRMEVLGALSKPASRAELLAVLDRWRPHDASVACAPAPPCSDAEIREANRHEQWVLHYQPQVNLHSAAVVGMEALVRWNHPERGLLYPADFIGVAEDSGEINALTDFVVQAALRQQALWRAHGTVLRMAINVSMTNLLVPDLYRRLETFAQEAQVSPESVTLEVTESRLMSTSPTPLENLVRLRLQRFTLSIDDFGTGHSSLAQLRDIPFTELKIDRGFVGGARHNSIIRPILEGSIAIAKSMALLSMAEGVESRDDWTLLRELDCDCAQGYFIGKPMPGEAVDGWMRNWSERTADLSA